ncbi:MAG TPA: hypothetical protein VGK73_39510 [Polyangiaceae bacterium]
MRAPRTFAFALIVASSANAEPLEAGPFRLDWLAPSGCPTAAETLARIEALLGAPVTEVLKTPLAARARVTEASPERFELAIETFRGEQRFTRDMQAPSCGELADAAALVLALAIDPQLRERTEEAPAVPSPESTPSPAKPVEPAASSTAAAPPPPPPVRPSETPRDAARSRHLVLLAGASAVADFGSVADVAFGPSATFGLRLSNLELDLDATWLVPTRSYAALDPEKGGDISLLVFGARPCFARRQVPFEGGLCGTFELGSIRGEGFGTATRSTRSALWMAAGGAFFARYAVASSLWLSARVTLLGSLQDIEFTLENVGTVHQVPAIVSRLGAGAEMHFD